MIRRIAAALLFLSLSAILMLFVGFLGRYRVGNEEMVQLTELTTAQYPEDPELHSVQYGRYQGRQLRLIRHADDHFDFIFEPQAPGLAKITFSKVDLSLFVPVIPSWVMENRDLQIVTVVEREWNRQQVNFDVEIEGGDGWEKEHLYSAELARNCLNAGLWEILLYTHEEGEKRIYYHGWFTLPLGYYKDLYEENNGLSYWWDLRRLERWSDPEGLPVDLTQLRTVVEEQQIQIVYDPNEAILVEGEQKRKLRTLNAPNFRSWGDFVSHREELGMASFVKPGRYRVDDPWSNEFELIAELKGATHRRIQSPATSTPLDEIELSFGSSRILISGFSLADLPQLQQEEYPNGFTMPMGISVPPISQSYIELKANPPFRSPYFSMMLNEDDEWLNHHRIGIDGVAMIRDPYHANQVHLYLISYERQTLLCHFILSL